MFHFIEKAYNTVKEITLANIWRAGRGAVSSLFNSDTWKEDRQYSAVQDVSDFILFISYVDFCGAAWSVNHAAPQSG